MPRLKPAQQIIEPVLTGQQIAAVHGVTLKTVHRWAERGEFSAFNHMPGGRIEVPVHVYQQFIERHRLAAAQ